MALIRLQLHEHPAPPHHEIRQKSVLDSGDRIVGTVANLYVDEDSRQLRFVDVVILLSFEALNNGTDGRIIDHAAFAYDTRPNGARAKY